MKGTEVYTGPTIWEHRVDGEYPARVAVDTDGKLHVDGYISGDAVAEMLGEALARAFRANERLNLALNEATRAVLSVEEVEG